MISSIPIKVCHVANSDISGGAARAAYRIHNALNSNQKNRIMSSMRVLKKFSNDNQVKGGPAFKNKLIFQLHRNLNRVSRYLYSLQYAQESTYSIAWPGTGLGKELNQYYEKNKIDIVNLHFLSDNTISVKEIGSLKMPLVWRLNDQWPFCSCEHYSTNLEDFKKPDNYIQGYKSSRLLFDIKKINWLIKKNSWKRKIHIIAPSNWIANCASKSILFKNQPIKVIPSAINLDFWKPLDKNKSRKELNLPLNKKLLLFGAIGGTSDYRKGGDLLFDALKILRTKFDDHFLENIELVIFGANDKKNLLKTEFKTHYAGFIKDDEILRSYYSACDLFILPSRQDNLPGTGIESHSCGTPIVSFDIGGLSDIIDNKKTGSLAKPFDPSSLASEIHWAIENDERNILLKKASRKKALDVWDEKKISKIFADFYFEVLNQ